MTRGISRAVAAMALIWAALGGTACGYALEGLGNTLPATLKIIGIPLFTNHSQTPDIDQVFTRAVREEFGNHGRFTVNPDIEGADAILTATIVSVQYVVTNFNTNHQATRYAVIVTANVEFKDVKDDNKILWSNPALQFRDEYDVTSNDAGLDPASFFRSDANALDRLSKNFARSVVTSILSGF